MVAIKAVFGDPNVSFIGGKKKKVGFKQNKTKKKQFCSQQSIKSATNLTLFIQGTGFYC